MKKIKQYELIIHSLNSKFKIKKLIIALCIILIVAIPRFFMIGLLPKWDGGEYYSYLVHSVQTFDFTLSGFLNNFRLCNHPTLAVSFFAMLGEFVSPGNAVGVQIVSLILTVLALLCLWELLQGFFADMNEWEAAVITVICSTTPLFLGTFSNFYPDYYLFIFMMFLIYSYYKHYEIMQIVWGICLAQTKEMGMLFLLIWILYVAIEHFLTTKGNLKEKMKSSFRYLPNYCSLISGLSVVAYLVWNNGMSSWQPVETEEAPYWGVDVYHIVTEIKELFLVNFIWIIWIGIIGGVIWLFKNRKIVSLKKCSFLIVLNLGYCLFCFIYVTAATYRYHIAFVLFTTILFFVILHEIFRMDHRWYYVIAGVIVCLYGLQTFFSIDPITNMAFDTYDAGNGMEMVSIGKNSINFSDCAVYNFQYTWIDRAIDKALREVSYDEDMLVVSQKTTLQLNGNNATKFFTLYWDKNNKKRTFLQDTKSGPIQYLPYENPNGINVLEVSGFSINDLKSIFQPRIVILHFSNIGESYTEGFYQYLHTFYNNTQNGVVSDYGLLTYEVYELKEDKELEAALYVYLTHSIQKEKDSELMPEYDCDAQAETRPLNSQRNITKTGDKVVLQCSYACYNEYSAASSEQDSYEMYPGILETELQLGRREFLDCINEALIGVPCGEMVSFEYTFSDYNVLNPYLIGRKVLFRFNVVQILEEVIAD